MTPPQSGLLGQEAVQIRACPKLACMIHRQKLCGHCQPETVDTRQRDIFPIAVPETERVNKFLSRGCQQRVGKRLAMQHDTPACIGALNELYGNPSHFEAGERQNRLSAAQKLVVNH
eukprot:4752690-Amphidinium_carterae.1